MINIVVWLILGLLTSLAVNTFAKPAMGGVPVLNLTAGVLGAVLGGTVFLIFDTAPLSAFNLWGVLVAVAGACVTIGLAWIALGRPL